MAIGFIGLGVMGGRMARRLLDAGHEVVGYDPDPESLGRFGDAGGLVAASPADLAGRVETVLLSLPSPRVVTDVVGDLATGTSATVVVDLSTTGQETAIAAGRTLGEAGIAFVDAPVSGGAAGAESGKLAVMASCPATVLDRVGPVLSHLGRVFQVGEEPGLGQAMKLLNNFLSATSLAATAEALVFGVKAGLDPETAIEVLNASSGRSSASQDKFPRAVLSGAFDFGFTMDLVCKDLSLYREELAAAGLDAPVSALLVEHWLRVRSELGGAADFTEIVRPLEKTAGVEVRRKS